MRQKERIPILYDLLKRKSVFYKFTNTNKDLYYSDFIKNYDDLLKKNCSQNDQRIGQFLINENIIPDSSSWFYEDSDWFVKEQLINWSSIHFWGSRGLNGDEPLKFIPLKDLTDDHIKSIVRDIPRISPQYLEYFNSRLNNNKTNMSTEDWSKKYGKNFLVKKENLGYQDNDKTQLIFFSELLIKKNGVKEVRKSTQVFIINGEPRILSRSLHNTLAYIAQGKSIALPDNIILQAKEERFKVPVNLLTLDINTYKQVKQEEDVFAPSKPLAITEFKLADDTEILGHYVIEPDQIVEEKSDYIEALENSIKTFNNKLSILEDVKFVAELSNKTVEDFLTDRVEEGIKSLTFDVFLENKQLGNLITNIILLNESKKLI